MILYNFSKNAIIFKTSYIYQNINVCSEIPFSKNLHHIETSKLTCNTNQTIGFYMMQIFTEKFFQTDINKYGVWKNAPGKKSHEKFLPGRLSPPEKLPPGKLPPRKLSPEKMSRRKIAPGKMTPKNCFTSFLVVVDIILKLFIFKLFIVTSFRGVSITPATFIMDFLLGLADGIN